MRASSLLSLVAVCGAGCSDLVLPDDPAQGPEATAEALWRDVDEYYAYFELKGVDWQAVGDTHLPSVTAATSDPELFDVLSAMLLELRDGHVVLDAPVGRFQWTGWYDEHPANYLEGTVDGYLTERGGSAGGAVAWGRLADGIGYIRIPSFGRPGVGPGVDAALESLGPLNGVVVDIRHNGGGSDDHAEAAASRFALERVHYRTVRYKAGPAHDDFGPEIRDFIAPGGRRSFEGPVVVLQNRRVFSSAETFVLAMRVRPGVTFVGDSTGGGSGNPIPRELPNHWLALVSRWQEWAADGTVFEGVGLPPDVPVTAPDDELAAGQDRLLERAVELLQGG